MFISNKKNKKSGFTLIEILVVTVIIFTLSGIGVAAYNRFNQVQVLKQSAEDLKSVLRDAQNSATAGQKSSDCNSPPRILDHWRFEINDSNTYSIEGSCQGLSFSPTSYDTPTNITLSPTSGVVDFKPLGEGVTNGSLSTITLTSSSIGSSIDITISATGDITVGAMY